MRGSSDFHVTSAQRPLACSIAAAEARRLPSAAIRPMVKLIADLRMGCLDVKVLLLLPSGERYFDTRRGFQLARA